MRFLVISQEGIDGVVVTAWSVTESDDSGNIALAVVARGSTVNGIEEAARAGAHFLKGADS